MNTEFQESTLLAALRAQGAGLYVEAAPAGMQASGLAREFAEAGWQGIALTVAESGAGTDIDALLVGAGVMQADWMAVRGGSAVRALEHWQASACRPLALLVESGSLALPAVPAPAWRATLMRNGYLYAIGEDGYHLFIRSDHAALHAQVAERASLAWNSRLQTSRNALALAQREAEQARSALLMAQANGMAASARATMLRQQIDAIHASTSWQSTRLLRWAARLWREPGPALRQLRGVARTRLAALPARLLGRLAQKMTGNAHLRGRIAALAERHPALARRVKALLAGAAPAMDTMTPALPPAIDPNNIVGPQFKTLLLDELGRGLPPASS